MEDKEDNQLHILDGEIVGIQFGLATHKEISTASVSGFPISHSSQLTNPFLGLPLEFGKCDSCGTSEPGKCEGHFGYIELPIPIYHPSHVSELKRMLSLLCLKCLKLKNNQTRGSGVAERLFSCCQEASQITIREVKTTDGAYNLQLKFPSRQHIDWSFLERYGFRYGNDSTRTLLPYEVNEMLKRISQETRRKFSRKGFFPQDGYIMKYVPVPPNCLSALDISDGVSVMSSDLSISMLKKVLKQVEIIRSSRSGEPNFESHEVEANDLQSAVDQYLQVRGTVKSAKDVNERFGIHKEPNGSSTKAWLEKMRTLFIRKGSGFSSRSVITGDAYKRVNEIGIPFEIAQRITFEEKVNSHNVQFLQELVDNKSCLTYRDGSITFSLREGSKGHTCLRPGQVVHRRIMDGDMVFINRPPTTHKHSLQALSVYVHDGHTVKINPLICGPLSADFDGDCIHLFYPQSLAAKAEVLELFSVEKQLLSSHSGNLNLQLTSDSLLSLKTMFKAYFLDRAAAQQLAMFVSSSLPQPAVRKSCSAGLIWTAQQILQTALPSQFDCIGERYLISNGEVVNADFSRDVVQAVINEIVISIFFEKGPDAVFKFFNSLQPLLMEYIFCEGFSVGLEDFYMSRTAMDSSRGDFKVISSLLSQLRSTYNQLMELQLENHIRLAKLPATEFILRSSSIGDLIEYKSESAMTKVVQQIGFLGLQISDRGKFYTKTLVEEMASHFESKYPPDIDYPSAKHGFIESCFFHGLDPYEAMVHSISSREVMVRSTRGLSEPGTLFKNLMAILRDVIICYDGTVRNVCSNSIIQFEYGVKAGIKAQSLFPAGEPVGVLAATAMSNPAYKAVLDSTPSSNSSWEQMKEILQCRVNFKNDVTDRRVILYFNYCGCGKRYCQEKATYLVKNHLEKVILKSVASCFMIEYRSPQSIGDATVVGHIHLKKMKLQELKVSMEALHNKCKETIILFGKKKKKTGSLYKMIEVAFSECCSFECADESSGIPCLSFFWKDNTEIQLEKKIQLFADEVYHVLLDTVIKGDPRISSANIIWASPDTSTWIRNPSRNQKGELALDVLTEKSAVKESGDAWRVVLDSCIPVLHMIDTTRSIPYAIKQVQELLGISCAFDQAVQRLSSSVTKVAKGVLKEHLILLANSMTCAGNLVGFTTGGYKALSHSLDVQVPFTEATLYTPRKCFERAAEKCHTDSLSSVVASCAWGKHVAVGTGSRFDLIWDQKETCLNPKSSMDVYELLNMVRSSANGEPVTACLGAEVDDLMPDDDMDDWNLSPERDFGSEKPIFEDGDEFKKFLDNQPADWEKVSNVENGVGDGGNWGGDKDRGIDNDESWSGWGSNRKVQEEPDRSNELDTATPWQSNDNSSWGTKKSKTADTNWGTDKNEAASIADANWGTKKSEAADTNWGTKKSEAAGASWGAKKSEPDGSWGKSAVSDQPENTATAWGKQQTHDKGEQEPKWGKPNKDGEAGSSWGKTAVCDQPENTATAWGKQQTHSKSEQEPKWGKPNKDEDAGSSWGKTAVCNQQENTATEWGKQQTHNESEQEPKWGKPKSPQVSDGWGSPIEKATTSQGWGLPNERQQKWEKPQTPQQISPKETDSHGWGSPKETSSQGWGSPRDTSSQGWGTPKSRGDGPKGWGSNNAEWKGKNRPPMSQGRDNSSMNLMFTVTRQRLDMFTSEEQDILSDIEPLMRSIRRVMHQSGYNDGDPLSATDQSYVIDNVLNYHPDKAAKMGAGIDHIIVNKHSSFQDSRCFFVVSTDGSQQDFSYRKCLENFLKVKYPDLAEEFTGKYFRPRQRGNQPQTPTAETPQPTPNSEATQPQTPVAETPVLEPETTGADNAA